MGLYENNKFQYGEQLEKLEFDEQKQGVSPAFVLCSTHSTHILPMGDGIFLWIRVRLLYKGGNYESTKHR